MGTFTNAWLAPLPSRANQPGPGLSSHSVTQGLAPGVEKVNLALEEIEPELGDDVALFVSITYGYD